MFNVVQHGKVFAVVWGYARGCSMVHSTALPWVCAPSEGAGALYIIYFTNSYFVLLGAPCEGAGVAANGGAARSVKYDFMKYKVYMAGMAANGGSAAAAGATWEARKGLRRSTRYKV